MRMWMVNPKILCDKHLAGEHVECHMFVGSINKGKSIAGHTIMNQAEPRALMKRHDDLAAEMLARGFKHESPLIEPQLDKLPRGAMLARVNVGKALADLLDRCPKCVERFNQVYGASDETN